MEKMQIGQIQLTWLDGGITHLDGGAMFGVVPKALWSRKYPNNEQNQIPLKTDPILVQVNGKNILIESGIGNGKLNDKQKRNYGVTTESKIEESLAELGLSRLDIDFVLLTHLHFDHACGLTMWEGEQLVPTFPNAKHIVSQIEWDEMREPNIRSRNTYWVENWQSIVDLVQPFNKEIEVVPGIKMVHTGGHSAGHALILLESMGEKGIHLADLLPTHAHFNPLWVLAFDDYPMDSIFSKEKWMKEAIAENRWFIFYHDAVYRAVKWDNKGEMTNSLALESQDE